jgi:hypothetical protein
LEPNCCCWLVLWKKKERIYYVCVCALFKIYVFILWLLALSTMMILVLSRPLKRRGRRIGTTQQNQQNYKLKEKICPHANGGLQAINDFSLHPFGRGLAAFFGVNPTPAAAEINCWARLF